MRRELSYLTGRESQKLSYIPNGVYPSSYVSYMVMERVRFGIQNQHTSTAATVANIWKTGLPFRIFDTLGRTSEYAANNTTGTNHTGGGYTTYFEFDDPDNVTRFELTNGRNWYGEIPEELLLFINLERLIMPNNLLYGFVPDFSNHTLIFFNVGDNRNLIGAPPDLSGSYATLINYNINTCGFSGSFSDFSRFTAITSFDASANSGITGQLPMLGNCLGLVTLNVRSCSITDSLPSWLSNLVALVTLRLDQNRLTGTIPSLSALVALVTANFNNNTGINGYTASIISVTCTSFTAVGCSLSTADVDQILSDFNTNLASRPVVGTINLSGSTNGVPSAAGVINKNNIIAHGWTVTTN